VALDVHLKRRFVASEFAEYRYCPRRYRLSRISGVLSPEVKAPGGKGLPNGLLLGTVVHRVLAAWDFGDESSLDAALEAVLRGEALSETEEGGLLRAEAKRMIASAKRAGAFAEIAAVTERMNEYPLAARIDDFVVEGVADSVHRLADGTFEVVDYKTDRVESREVAQKAEHYELQLACYAWALAKSGLNVSRASLIFVRPAKGHAWTCDAAQLEKWEEQLRRCVADIRSGSFNEMREGPCRCGYCGWLCDRERADDGDFDLAGDDIEQSEPE